MKKTKERLKFLIEEIKHPREVGTFTQSSKHLCRAVKTELTGTNIVELGAGLGPITRTILSYLPPEGHLTAIEINKRFYTELQKIKDPRLTVLNCGAEEFEKYVDCYDCIVCGVPLTSIDKQKRKKILKASCSAKRFIQYKYANSKKILKAYFSKIKQKRVLKNFPPAIVYVCSND